MTVISESRPVATTSGVGTFATLVNSKIIVPSNTSNYFAVERFFLVNLMAAMIDQVYIDERWYLSRNPDVREAISNGVIADVREHYRKFGYFEGRPPYKIEVDAAWYENAYPDVREAIRREDIGSAQQHFESSGFFEGRLPFAGFKLRLREGQAA